MVQKAYLGALAAAALSSSAASPKDAAANPPDNERRQIAAALENVATAVKQNAKPDETEKPCTPGHEKRSSDLCAQWKAADAAKYAADIAFWVGAVGSLLGAATLIVAVRAALWAKKAALHTEQSAVAAHDANRPWLELEIFERSPFIFDEGGATFGVNVRVHNRGASPATNVLVVSELVPIPTGGGIDNEAAVKKIAGLIENLRVHDRQVGRVVFPSSEHVERHAAHAPVADIDAAEAIDPGNVLYQLGLGVRYRFGDRTGETVYGYIVVALGTDRLAIHKGENAHQGRIRLDDTYAGYAT